MDEIDLCIDRFSLVFFLKAKRDRMLFPTGGRHWQTAIRAERMERIILPPTNNYLHVLILFSSSCLDDFTYKVFHARSTRFEKVIPDAISSKFSLCENFRFAFVHELLKKNTDQSRRTWLVSYVLSNAATRYARCDWPVFFSVFTRNHSEESSINSCHNSIRNINYIYCNYYLNLK